MCDEAFIRQQDLRRALSGTVGETQAFPFKPNIFVECRVVARRFFNPGVLLCGEK